MLSNSREKALNKSTRFEIDPKSVYTSRDEGFDKNSVSTSRKKLLPLTGISAKIQENGFNKQECCSFLKVGLYLSHEWCPLAEKSYE